VNSHACCRFSFELPESLIAHYPQAQRSGCRLLSLDGPSGETSLGIFSDLLDKLEPGDLLVFNNTRVIPARLFGRKASGGKLEVLVERVLDEHRVLAHEGYKGAFSSIVDANVTTLITAVILYAVGTGSIKGFAITTTIGVATSMFTAIVGTRAIVNLLYGGKRINKLSI